VAPLAVLLLLAATAPACGTGAVERLICADPALAGRETVMQQLYAAALGSLAEPQRAAQQARQTQWLHERAGCVAQADPGGCLGAQLDRRSVELRIALGKIPLYAAASYQCPGAQPHTLLAIFYHSDPAAVRLSYQGHEMVAFAAPAASGARYTAGNLQFWEHQGIARLSWAGTVQECPKK
jgi:uncharacterized protein